MAMKRRTFVPYQNIPYQNPMKTKRRKTGPRTTTTLTTQLPFSSAARVQAATMGRPSGSFQEVKSFDCVIAGTTALVAAGAVAADEPGNAFVGITELNCMVQGSTVATRIGNKIVMKSLHLRTSLHAPSTCAAIARLMLVYDKQPNGAFPNLGAIILNEPGSSGTPYSGLNIANKSRFLMLRDQFYCFDGAAGLIHQVTMYVKGKWEGEFGASAGNIGDFRSGAMLLICYYTVISGAGAIYMDPGVCRIRYYD